MINYLKAYALYPLTEKHQKRDIRSKLKYIENFEGLNFDKRKALQEEKLIQTLQLCHKFVPYYRELYSQIDFNPLDLRGNIKYLNQLPYITKDTINEQGERLLNEALLKNLKHSRKTGGSTGISTIIQYSNQALDWTAAANLYAVELTSRKHHQSECHISAHFTEVPHWKDKWREKIKCWAMNRNNAYISSFNDENLEQLWKQLENIKPVLLQGHPSTLFALAVYIEKKKINTNGIIKFFESTGEMIDSKKIEFIEKIMNLKIFNRFGNAEFGVFAHSEKNPLEMKIFDSIVYPEELTLGNGQNELILTGLTNDLMPLIRYKTGDLASIKSTNEGRFLNNVVGRMHDCVTVNNQSLPTHYIQDIIDHKVGGIIEFQISLKKDHKPSLNLVLGPDSSKEHIINRINQYFPDGFNVNFISLDSLSRVGWRGKFRYVIEE